MNTTEKIKTIRSFLPNAYIAGFSLVVRQHGKEENFEDFLDYYLNKINENKSILKDSPLNIYDIFVKSCKVSDSIINLFDDVEDTDTTNEEEEETLSTWE